MSSSLRSGDRVVATTSLDWGRVREGTPGRILSINVLGEHLVDFGTEQVRARATELARISDAGPFGGPAPRWWASTNRQTEKSRPTPGTGSSAPASGSLLLRGLLAVPLIIVAIYALIQMA